VPKAQGVQVSVADKPADQVPGGHRAQPGPELLTPKPGRQAHSSAETAPGAAPMPTGHLILEATQSSFVVVPSALVRPNPQGRQASYEPPAEKVPTGQMVQGVVVVPEPKPGLQMQAIWVLLAPEDSCCPAGQMDALQSCMVLEFGVLTVPAGQAKQESVLPPGP
jgi:hypothetical protein